jgi:hypothetical protein
MSRLTRDGLFFGTLPFALAASPASAQITIGADAHVQAASNPLLLAGPDKDAIMGEISVKPEFKTISATGNSLDLAGVLTERHYSRLYNNYVLGNVRATGELRDNERLSVQASAGYLRDVAGDTLTSNVDGLVSPQSVRNDWQGQFSATWRPNARTMILPLISGERTTYDSNSSLPSSNFLQNTTSASAEIGFRYRLTANSWLGVRPVADFSKTRTQPSLHRLALFGTLNRTFSRTVTLVVEAGVEHVDGADATLLIPPRKAATSFSGSFSLCRAGQTENACLKASVGSEVSAIYGFQRREAVGVNLSKRLDERRTVTAVLDYQRISAPTGISRLRDVDAASARLTLDWRITRAATISAEVQYARATIDSGDRPRSGYVGLRFRWQPRLR